MINRKRMLDDFFAMVKITCSSGKERQIADFIKTNLETLGLTVKEDQAGQQTGGDCGNIWAYKKGNVAGVPVLMLSAHLDSVEPCSGIQPRLQDGVITSGGDTVLGADDKAGVAAIMEAFRVVAESDMEHGDIQAVFTVQEESGLYGSKNIDKQQVMADFCYVLDSSGAPGNIIIKAPGENTIKVMVKGKTAHAGIAPEEGINAIVVAGKALTEVKQGRIDEETTCNIGIIKGGQATNIVPDLVEITCEARSHNMDKLQQVTEEMKATFERVVEASGGGVEVVIEPDFAAYALSEKLPVVTLAMEAAESIGLTPQSQATGGGSDANVFNSYGLPAVVLGMGMEKVHTAEEYIKEEDLYQGAKWALALIKTAVKHKT